MAACLDFFSEVDMNVRVASLGDETRGRKAFTASDQDPNRIDRRSNDKVMVGKQ